MVSAEIYGIAPFFIVGDMQVYLAFCRNQRSGFDSMAYLLRVYIF